MQFLNWTVWEQGIHLLKRLLFLSEVDFKKLRLISQRGFKGDTSPLEDLKLKGDRAKEVNERESRYEQRRYKYEGTNIGNAYDSLYWSWVRMKGYHNRINEEELLKEKIRQAKELIKG